LPPARPDAELAPPVERRRLRATAAVVEDAVDAVVAARCDCRGVEELPRLLAALRLLRPAPAAAGVREVPTTP
jgi:hypothetical protein